MQFRFREMADRPDFFQFNNDDREEWFVNGVFTYNISRLIKDLSADRSAKETETPWINRAIEKQFGMLMY